VREVRGIAGHCEKAGSHRRRHERLIKQPSLHARMALDWIKKKILS